MTISVLRSIADAIGVVLLFAGAAFADVAVVPEPATTTLLAVGGAGMYLLKRCRRK